ncbi:hypothetical protein NPIL_665281 [Nephila pilipes]|uniref:Uncharacterized protein n=1 Tax=Nephila pilipes TaxID=299642 RepID=A0A8X6U4B1_NEPPI|nr:hypothetical protein NPIL_665281 [Nephila pilipes]
MNRLSKGVPHMLLEFHKRQRVVEDTVPHCARPPMHPCKIMFCIWWTGYQAVHYELLPMGQMVIMDPYSQQLECVQLVLQQKESALVNHKYVLFLHDNVAWVVRDHTVT